MKLLFDENLSPHLISALKTEFPGSQHVEVLGLRGRSDLDVWTAAREGGFVLISKDGDLRQLSFTLGAPPKVVWLSVGNAGTESIAHLLRIRRSMIELFATSDEETLLPLSSTQDQTQD